MKFEEVLKQHLNYYMTDDELWELAQFVKRVTFDDVYRRSEGNGETQKENAYYTLGVIGKLQNCLKDAGFSPR